MKLTRNSLLLFISLLCSCGNNEKHVTYYENGNIKEEVQVREGKAHGVCKLYYESGQLHKITNYKMGRRHGHFLVYDKSGHLSALHSYSNGRDSGMCYEFYPNGFLKKKFFMLNGMNTGVFLSYFSNALLKFESYSVNDSTYFYTEYDSVSGNVRDEFYYIDIRPDKLTISDNENCKFDYFLYGPKGGVKTVDFVLLNDGLDTVQVKKINVNCNDTTVVEFGPLKKSNSYLISSVAHLGTKIFKDTIRVSVIKFN